MKTGEIVLELAPGRDNPRNSEGAFVECEDGTVLFAYSRFGGGAQDDAQADIALMRSTDGGRSFESQGILFKSGPIGVKNLMSVSFLKLSSGEIGLFYLVRKNEEDMRLVLRRSADGGYSWSEAVEATPEKGYFVVNNSRIRRLKSGRILVPAARHFTGPFDGGSEALFFISDDDGRSFRKARDKCALPYANRSNTGLQEPGVEEIGPDIVWGWARTDLGRQYQMFSLDGGEHWTTPEPSIFSAPPSPMDVCRLKDGRWIVVWNPIPLYNGRTERMNGIWTGGRTPLSMAVSSDGRHFYGPLELEGEPGRGYCYTALLDTREALLMAYCAGGAEDGGCLNRLRIRRIEHSVLASALRGLPAMND